MVRITILFVFCFLFYQTPTYSLEFLAGKADEPIANSFPRSQSTVLCDIDGDGKKEILSFAYIVKISEENEKYKDYYIDYFKRNNQKAPNVLNYYYEGAPGNTIESSHYNIFRWLDSKMVKVDLIKNLFHGSIPMNIVENNKKQCSVFFLERGKSNKLSFSKLHYNKGKFTVQAKEKLNITLGKKVFPKYQGSVKLFDFDKNGNPEIFLKDTLYELDETVGIVEKWKFLKSKDSKYVLEVAPINDEVLGIVSVIKDHNIRLLELSFKNKEYQTVNVITKNRRNFYHFFKGRTFLKNQDEIWFFEKSNNNRYASTGFGRLVRSGDDEFVSELVKIEGIPYEKISNLQLFDFDGDDIDELVIIYNPKLAGGEVQVDDMVDYFLDLEEERKAYVKILKPADLSGLVYKEVWSSEMISTKVEYLLAEDINGDGKKDIMAVDIEGYLHYWINQN